MAIRWGNFRDQLDQDFAADCDTCLGPLSAMYVVDSGWRSSAKQAALYAQGRTAPGEIVTNAQPGQSPHEFGLAIDVGVLMPDGSVSWNYSLPAFSELWSAVAAAPRLHSGRNFPSPDQDHIERLNWRQFIGS